MLLQTVRAILPAVVGDILGDALWAMMITWIVGAIIPTASRWRRALIALATCWLVEASQLYHTPLLDQWRATTLGHLTLGTDFDPRDLAAYALGVLCAVCLEQLFLRLMMGASSPPTTV